MKILIVLGCSRGLVIQNENIYITRQSHVYYRLIKTKILYEKYCQKEQVIILCSGGGVCDSYLMKQFLLEEGIPETRIFCENRSRNTIENCLYSYKFLSKFLKSDLTAEMLCESQSKTNDIYAKRTLINTHNPEIILITNNYHLFRSEFIFTYFSELLFQPFNLETVGCETPGGDEEWKKIETNILQNNFRKLLQSYSN